MKIRRVELADRAECLRMRTSLWPKSLSDHAAEIDAHFANAPPALPVFVADRGDGSLAGLLEAGTRPYAEGCKSSPVAFLEGWWVDEDVRRTRVGAHLVEAAEAWARSLGLSEIASDANLANEVSHAAHRALGYQEATRLVCFRKQL